MLWHESCQGINDRKDADMEILKFERGEASDILYFKDNGDEKCANIFTKGNDYYITIANFSYYMLKGTEKELYLQWKKDSDMINCFGIDYKVMEKWEKDGIVYSLGYLMTNEEIWYAGRIDNMLSLTHKEVQFFPSGICPEREEVEAAWIDETIDEVVDYDIEM